jgi:ribosomal protein L19
MASGDNSGHDFAIALHLTAMHIDTIQRTRERHMSKNRLYLLLGEHLKKLLPEDQVFPAMVEYCKRHGLDTPWDNDLNGFTPEEATGKQINVVFRINDDNPEHTETVTGTVLAIHKYRGILAMFPSGMILVNQIDRWEFA